MNCIDIKISYELINNNATFTKIKQSDDESNENSSSEQGIIKGIQMFKLSY